jgi:hypothetical protein
MGVFLDKGTREAKAGKEEPVLEFIFFPIIL